MNNVVDSIEALKHCMEFLGLAPDVIEQPFRCKMMAVNHTNTSGSTGGQFLIDPHSHNGPKIEFDNTLRGYGLTYNLFVPQWQSFEFERKGNSGHLTIQNRPPSKPPYHFEIKFEAPAK